MAFKCILTEFIYFTQKKNETKDKAGLPDKAIIGRMMSSLKRRADPKLRDLFRLNSWSHTKKWFYTKKSEVLHLKEQWFNNIKEAKKSYPTSSWVSPTPNEELIAPDPGLLYQHPRTINSSPHLKTNL